MELTSPGIIKDAYLQILAEDEKYNDVFKELVNRDEKKPILTVKYLNGENTPDYDNEQRELSEIMLDLNVINNSAVEIKNKVAELLSLIDTQADLIMDSVEKESDRIMDINMLCGINSEYNMSIPVYTSNFTGNFEAINDRTIGANLTNQSTVDYTVVSVSGNGYSGNNYVYNNNVFETESNDYSNLDYIKDDSNVTSYEYSRLVTTDKTEVIDQLINYDSKEAECVLTLMSVNSFNRIYIDAAGDNLTVKNIETSQDGISFTSRLTNPLRINNKEDLYNNLNYIYGSGTLCFPYSYYVRITLSNDDIEDDSIAIQNEDETDITLYPNTRRKKIRINTVKLYNSNYTDTSVTSEELLEAGSVDKIGLFVNQYIPDHFFSDTEYITYYLIINGTEHQVVPVNSSADGIKLIKFSESEDSTIAQNYVENITETIKSAQIKINIKTYNNTESPYISNIKLCLGKEDGSIYVVS